MQQKTPVHLEDEGVSRIVVPPPFAQNRASLAHAVEYTARNHRALTGASRNELLRQKWGSRFAGWLRGVIREGRRRCFQPGHRSLRARGSL